MEAEKMRKIAEIILCLLFLMTITSCSNTEIEVKNANSEFVSSETGSCSTGVIFDSHSLSSASQPDADDSVVSSQFYLGRWEYYEVDYTDSSDDYYRILYGFIFNEDGTATSYMGFPNSDVIMRYEGTFEVIEETERKYTLQLNLELVYDRMQYQGDGSLTVYENVYHEAEIEVIKDGPSYRMILIFLTDDTLYGMHNNNWPYSYVLI